MIFVCFLESVEFIGRSVHCKELSVQLIVFRECAQCAVGSVKYLECSVSFLKSCVHYAVCIWSLECAISSVQCVVSSVQYAVCSVQCAAYSAVSRCQ